MRKSLCVSMVAQRLGLRVTRLTSLAQRLAESGLLPVSSGPPYPDLMPTVAGLQIHTGENPYAELTTARPDGLRIETFGDLPAEDRTDRVIVIRGAALFGIARELDGQSATEVDSLLKGTK